ncbi:MAG: ATP-dependent RecD-like DNA helicase [Firmicutes bacterium]|nr:ATP-dependent RecD-like DNA helicase [Bacillota bacterium]
MATQKIRATAEAFLLQRADGYAILRVRLFSGEAMRAVGTLAEVPLGAECEFVGRFLFHERYGRQFMVDAYYTVLPTSAIGIERFLASGRFKGVGAQTAKRLVTYFGVHTLDVLEQDPEQVAQVPGLTPKRAAAIVAAFATQRELARLATFLRGHDLPLHLADKLVDAYGGSSAALQTLQEHPYQVAQDVRGIGFKTADQLAHAAGMSDEAPERLLAALQHVLREAEDEGHMYLPQAEWLTRAAALTGVALEQVAAVSGQLSARGAVVYRQVDQDAAVYGAYLDRVEQGIASRISELLQATAGGLVHEGDDACAPEVLFTTEALDSPVGSPVAADDAALTASQRAAALAPLSSRLVVLTGGPGTGKTTTVQAMAASAEAVGWQVVLAAPTGRAAKRLAQSTGYPALTIHRLLEVGQQGGGSHGFARNRKRRLEGNLFIIDESSMIDAPLFMSLLDALPQDARLVLVGDPEQLPAVGPGQVLRDLIASGVATVHELQYVFRQGKGSMITAAAHAVRSGQVPVLARSLDADCFFLEEDNAQAVADLVVELAATRLPRYLQVDARLGIQVLSPMRRGTCGVDALNERLSAKLASQAKSPSLSSGERIFRVGDKVMNMRNDYDRDIYNGDMGLVTQVNEQDLTVRVDDGSQGRDVVFTRAQCAGLSHAYAVSVHKSQGSEYLCVIIPLAREHAIMLHRELIYTAMTRARRLLVLVGSREALAMAVSRKGANRRYTGLQQALRSAVIRVTSPERVDHIP